MRYTREDGCRAWLTYGNISPNHLVALIHQYGSCESIYDGFRAEGREVLEPFVTKGQLDILSKQSKPEAMHEMMLTMQKWEMGIVSMDDEGYPDSLKNLSAPPYFLFYRGDLECLQGRCVTMIGARKASPAGLEATQRIARDLSRRGVHIVSGMAVGIDSAALAGGIEGGSPVIGVMACGLDRDYPVDSSPLKAMLLKNGGVMLSEYPPGTPALSWRFPLRNRIMSGLSKAVLMMECRIRSGSMSTVNHALDQGREVFAYPGETGSVWAEGAQQLLREGANYFTSAQDVLEDLGWMSASESFEARPTLPTHERKLPVMTPSQQQLYECLLDGERSYDQLAAATGFDASTLSVALTMLQIAGLVQSLPGKVYKAVKTV